MLLSPVLPGPPLAWAVVPVLTAMPGDHARAQALPRPGAVHGVVPAAVGLAGVVETPAPGAARDDTANGAELHAPASSGVSGAVGTARWAALAWASRRACRSARRGCFGRQIDRRPPPSPRGAHGRTWPETDAEPRAWKDRVIARSVCRDDAPVYSPAVLRLRDQPLDDRFA